MAVDLDRTFIERLLSVVECTAAERRLRLCCDSEALACGCSESHPAQIDVVAILLRTDIWEELIGHSALVDAYKLAILAVAITLDRASSIVSELLELLWHWQLHTEAEHWHVLFLGLCITSHWSWFSALALCLKLLIDSDRTAVRADSIGEDELGLDRRHLILGSHHSLALVVGSIIECHELHLWVEPLAEAVLLSGSHVIVGRGTPEIRRHCLSFSKIAHTIDIILGEEACCSVELHIDIDLHSMVAATGMCFCLTLSHFELLASHSRSCIENAIFRLELVFEVEEILCSVGHVGIIADGNHILLLWLDIELAHCTHLNSLAIADKSPLEQYVTEILEEVLVINLDALALQC